MQPIKTTSGLMTGIKTEYGYAFLGIPYAHAGRFKKPVMSQWSGVRECTEFSPRAFQCPENPDKCSEDCLSLNIYTPDLAGSYPVVIDIHGGGFQSGSNSGHYSHPERFVRDHRCIYIPIQYRLGIWGYLYLGKELGEEYAASGNCGTLDQLAAISWVSENIERFGGDPKRITLMGNSAGAKAIGALITTPESRGLFDKIILLSGSSQCIRTPETAGVVTKRFLDILNCGAEELLTMPNDVLLKAQRKLTDRFASCMFGPVSDDIVIPKDWKSILRSGKAWNGSAYIGTNRYENGHYAREIPDLPAHIDEILDGLFGINSRYARQAWADAVQDRVLTKEEQTELWIRIISDYMYRTHADRTASILSANGMNVWQYSFEWLPAFHDTDRRFVWYELNWKNENISEDKIPAALKLSEQIYESFIAFIMNGNPNNPCLPHLDNVTPDRRSKWMFGEETYVKVWENGETDAIPSFPEDVYCLNES